MTDKRDGGLYWGLDDKGVPVRGGEKHAYGISFAIYGACGVYSATHDAKALDFAKRAYAWLDAHAHDAKNGGYYEALTRAGKPILTTVDAAQPSDEIGTRYGFKTMNTHIHLLESLSALYAVWPDAGLRARLEEMFALVRDKVAVESVGCLNYQFTPDWKPLPDHDSFGHDVETALSADGGRRRSGPAQRRPHLGLGPAHRGPRPRLRLRRGQWRLLRLRLGLQRNALHDRQDLVGAGRGPERPAADAHALRQGDAALLGGV